MEFVEKINELKERAINLKDSLKTEEATKNALVLPFLNALGYDVFNPLEVIPEYIADSRLKKDEKVDYAILLDNKPIILIECKKVENEKLDIKKHGGQLFKYFTASKAKFIIFTNGGTNSGWGESILSPVKTTNETSLSLLISFTAFERTSPVYSS